MWVFLHDGNKHHILTELVFNIHVLHNGSITLESILITLCYLFIELPTPNEEWPLIVSTATII